MFPVPRSLREAMARHQQRLTSQPRSGDYEELGTQPTSDLDSELAAAVVSARTRPAVTPATPPPPADSPPLKLGLPEYIIRADNSPHVASNEFELTAAAVAGVVPDDTYTIDQAVNNIGFGLFQIKLSLITGLSWMADSMEMMILSILSPALRCSWRISSVQQASITTVVFIGMMISSPVWGKFSDRYGRRTALLISAVMLFYFGLLSSFSPTYGWILFLRCAVGFAVGCVPQGVTLYAEFLPLSQRGRCVVLMDSFWALGACLEVLLALFIMPTLGWRWLLGLSAVPLLLFVMICPFLPESARYHAACGDYDKALSTIKRIADENGKPMPLGRLILDDMQDVKKGRIRDLLIPELKRTTLLLWVIWFSCAFSYYGIVLMTTEMFQVEDPCHGGHALRPKMECQITCKSLTTSDYTDLLWTTLAEFPGIFVTVYVIEKFGRRKTMAVEFFMFSCFVFSLLVCTPSRTLLTVILFAARGIVSGVFNSAYVYTPEVYPTTLRAIGVGMCSAIARLGAMSTPFVAQVLLKLSVHSTIVIYGLMGLVSCVASMMLPIETQGRGMKETHH